MDRTVPVCARNFDHKNMLEVVQKERELRFLFADVAQLARVSAFQAEGCGFDPRHPLHYLVF